MYSEGPCEQKPIKNFGENGAWAYTGTDQIFWVPPIISGTDKATNFKFCTHILSIDQNNSPLKISWAVAGCVVRTLKTFKCSAPIYWAHRAVFFAIAMLSCMICVFASLRQSISESNSGLFSIVNLEKSVQGESNDHVTRWRHSGDAITSNTCLVLGL